MDGENDTIYVAKKMLQQEYELEDQIRREWEWYFNSSRVTL